VIDLLRDDSRPDHRTFLFATPANGKIAVSSTAPASVEVGAVKPRTRTASR
jgi:hypothetical protein